LGAAARAALAAHGVTTVFDLVWTLPSGWDDLRTPLTVDEAIAAAQANANAAIPPVRACVYGVVKSATLVPVRGRRFVRVVLAGDRKATLTASWFFAAAGILATAKVGEACLVVGRIAIDERGRARMVHPDLFHDTPDARGVRPRYPKLGVPAATLRKAIRIVLQRLPDPPDPVPAGIAARERMSPVGPLLASLHASASSAPPEESTWRAARERLAFAEAFTRAWQRLDAEGREGEAPRLPPNRATHARLLAEFGFPLTGAQERAIATVARDLAETTPMRRLLLGDVGTGKTAVALAAAAQCLAAGYQVAILAPTGVLAEQYMDAVGPLARATKAAVTLIAGGLGASAKRALGPLADGRIGVAVGTHALLRESVTFARLGLVIVDEQHRLGVAQRVALVHKGTRPHLLTLSATPIPRTLALALRGELATSTLDERPVGRVPVDTRVHERSALPSVIEEIRATAARGERAFFICPRIDDEEGEDAETLSATARAEELTRALAPVGVAVIHGAQKPDEQRRAMRAFRRGDAAVLVATTVVEVGVDVPEATLMVVDGAERFGLAQLHQLRGRVGRGDRAGRCVLLHGSVDSLAARRLEAVRTLGSGEAIAKADLALRGAGDLGGTRQSGVEEDLLYLDPSEPPAWLARLDTDVRAIHSLDPDLALPAHRGLALAVRRFARALARRDEAG
jgi:ATP-dependent DNA helicase RecG